MRRLLLISLCLWLIPPGAGAEADTAQRPRQPAAKRWFRADSEQGGEILRLESERDEVVRDYLARHPDPDLTASRLRGLALIYLADDRFVSLRRHTGSGLAQIEVVHPLPAGVLKTLPEEARDAVRLVRDTSSADSLNLGTCFVIRPDGLLLTAYHNVENATQVRVIFEDGSSYDATVREDIENSDLALLQIPALQLPYLSLAPDGGRLGTRVFTIGFPAPSVLGRAPKFTEGVVSSERGHATREDLMLLSLPIQSGNSGGPVVAEDGSVIGVVSASAEFSGFSKATGSAPQNVNWASRVDAVPALFDAPPARPPAQTRAEAIERVREAVCLVIAGRR